MSAAPLMDTARTNVGLYGKLPSAGDFVRRRLQPATIAALDRWLQARLPGLRDEWRLDAPSWRFAAARNVFGPCVLSGLFAASRDRVGRPFPVILAVEREASLSSTAWLDQAEAALRSAIDGEGGLAGVEALLNDLLAAANDEGSAAPHDLEPGSSVWWTPADPLGRKVFASAPDADAFAALVAPWRGPAAEAAQAEASPDSAPSGQKAQP